MKEINVVVVGLPGKMANKIVERILLNEDLSLIQISLNVPEVGNKSLIIDVGKFKVVTEIKTNYKDFLEALEEWRPLIAVDFTAPKAVNPNAEFYCKNNILFVMGTTGGNRERLIETVKQSQISAVIAPNMAKPIVLLQAMFQYAAENFPNVLLGFDLAISESHQETKKDTSGTAKAMVKYFNQLGILFDEDDIRKERRPLIQQLVLGVPRNFLDAHGWHTYKLVNDEVRLELTHNINGRGAYVEGTLDAIRFLHRKIQEGSRGEVFSMIDILRG